jgi:excisionase family DNA binding protein
MTIQDHPDFVSVAEAARVLGVSKSTVKRRIAAGQLDAEQLCRAQGVEYRVRIQRDVPVPPRDDPGRPAERSDSERQAPSTGTTRGDPAAISAAVAPLLERLVVADAVIAGHTATIREQAETIGALRAELGTAHARIAELEAPAGSTLTAPTASERPDPTPEPLQPLPWPLPPQPNVRALAPWVLLAAILVAVVVVGWWPGH